MSLEQKLDTIIKQNATIIKLLGKKTVSKSEKAAKVKEFKEKFLSKQ